MASPSTCLVVQDINDLYRNHIMGPVQFAIAPDTISNKTTSITPETLHFLTTNGTRYLMHGKYVYNFCHPEVESQISSLVDEVNLASRIGCDVVIHQGKNVKRESMTKIEAINNYVKNLTEVIERTTTSTTCLLLENSAGQGNELGSTLDELFYIYRQFDETTQDRIGFCLDTCHIFVAGELDMREVDRVRAFMDRFESTIGLSKLKCIHLNDSAVPFNGRRDHHDDLMVGYITNPLLDGKSGGLRYLCHLAHQLRIPLVFETPCQDTTCYDTQDQLVTFWSENQNEPPYSHLNQLGFNKHIQKGKK
jgi:apurinic endonuclease APN1